jgi:ring-1,2-phenylacetyl-CoA epoxidase subunit PaaD
VTSVARPDAGAVRRAIEAVPDPELPPVTVGNLGMLRDLRVDPGGAVHVELLPTFSGCPATEVIAEDVGAAARSVEGVTQVSVRFRFDPPWSPERIDEEGRERLRRFGITPPGGAVRPPALQGVTGRTQLPLAGGGSRRAEQRACPYCGSEDTETDSPFGPTPCRSIHYCRSCREPFEAFKDL